MARIKDARRSGDWGAVALEMRRGRGKGTFAVSPIAPFGAGASALIWKHLVTRIRASGWRIVIPVLLAPVAAAAAGRFVPDRESQSFFVFVIPYMAWIIVMVGMQAVKMELKQAEIIKAMPDTGFRIVGALVFSQWLGLCASTLLIGVSMMFFIPGIDMRMLALVVAGSVAAGFPCLAASAVAALMYPDTRDKLAMTIPRLMAALVMGVVIVPTAIVITVATLMEAGLAVMALLLLVVNAIVAWGALSIAGSVFRSADPNEG